MFSPKTVDSSRYFAASRPFTVLMNSTLNPSVSFMRTGIPMYAFFSLSEIPCTHLSSTKTPLPPW